MAKVASPYTAIPVGVHTRPDQRHRRLPDEIVPAHAKGDYRALCSKDKEAGVFLIEYRDGFRAAVAMLNGWLYEGDGGAFIFAGKLRSKVAPVSTHFYLISGGIWVWK